MPPIFKADEFEFAPGEVIPDHEDREPLASEVGTTKFSVQECIDRVGGACIAKAVDLTREEADQLSEARKRRIAANCLEHHVNIHTAPHVAVIEPIY